MLLFREVTHLSRSSASCGWVVKLPMPRLIPPSGGLLCSPALTSGYRAQPMSSTTDWSMAPDSTSPLAAPYTYGQLTMNPPSEPWKAERDSSSPAVDIAGGAAEERARSPTIVAASSPAGELISGV